jgi:AraC-like DNA-binding protein
MQHHEVDPPQELRDTIKCFWYTSRDFGETASSFEIVPDGYAEIIFHFGSSCCLSYGGGWQPMPSPLLMGLLQQPVWLNTQNRLEIIGVRCFPWTVFDLLGLPASKNGGRVVEHPLAQLQAPLAACLQAGKLVDALELVSQYFVTAHSRLSRDSLLGKAGRALRAAHGTLPVHHVAAAAHATVRTLERTFKHAAGYTVKEVSGLMRFEQVRNHLWRHPAANLANLAPELGYVDQAHLSREFKRYSGTTPAAFARQAQRGQAAASPDFVAFVQA